MPEVSLLAAFDAVTGAVLLLVGGLVWRRGRGSLAAVLLLLTSACWYAGALVPALVALHRGPLVHLLATCPRRDATLSARRLVVVLGWLMAVAGGTVGGPWPMLAVAALLSATATVRATQAARRGLSVVTPVVVGGLSYAAVLVVAGVNLLVDLDADLAVAIAYDVVVSLVALALGAGLWRAAPADDTGADVLTWLGTARDDGPGLEPQLRRALGDPDLAIGFWAPDRAGYVDEHGHDVIVAGHRASTTVMDDGRLVAAILHDPATFQDPGLLEGAVAAVRLTAANAAMRREARARVTRLAEARRRIVHAADLEAEALARRLVEGPQSRLRDVARTLSQQDPAGGTDARAAAALRRELEAAQYELQELARGVRPEGLAEGGLARAIPSLAANSAVDTTVSVEVDRLDPAIEAGLYFFCAEGLADAAKHASASCVRVAVWRETDTVISEVIDDGVGGVDLSGSGLRGLKDRIEALGGSLQVGPAASRGVRLLARVPIRVGSQR